MLKFISTFSKEDSLSFAFCIVASFSPDFDFVVLNLVSSSFNLRDSSLTFLKPNQISVTNKRIDFHLIISAFRYSELFCARKCKI